MIVSDIDPPVTPPRQSFLSNLPRSLSSLTGQSLRGNRNSQVSMCTCIWYTHAFLFVCTYISLKNCRLNVRLLQCRCLLFQPPVTCLDGGPPPLPPRTPNTLSPGSLSPRGPSPGGQVPRPPPVNMPSRYMEPNSISVQMNYPLAVTHPPAQVNVTFVRHALLI